jgi:hypothetical protein
MRCHDASENARDAIVRSAESYASSDESARMWLEDITCGQDVRYVPEHCTEQSPAAPRECHDPEEATACLEAVSSFDSSVDWGNVHPCGVYDSANLKWQRDHPCYVLWASWGCTCADQLQ